MRPSALLLATLLLWPSLGFAADFDVTLAYGQSRDFWKTVQSIQDKSGDVAGIQATVYDKYGKPDILYSQLEAAYSYGHDYFDAPFLGMTVIGTRAEALAGGEISNPISPEIQAYANTTGIFSLGLRSVPSHQRNNYMDFRLLAGMGPEKRLYAQGAEFIDAIPIRSGMLFLGGAEMLYLNRSHIDGDFWITTDVFLRGVYFISTTPPPLSRPEPKSFATLRWKVQNEWLKETGSWFADRTRIGILSVLGQSPYPFLNLPVTWDYQQRLQLFPGFASISGIGGIARLLTNDAMPNLALYGGYFGGAFGGGLDLQLGTFVVNASTYGIENRLTPAREKTRLWNASIGFVL